MGPHLPFHPDLPPAALASGADAAVTSPHKLLAGLSQAALLHANAGAIDLSRLAAVVRMLQTTSPLIPILASLDVCRRQMALDGPALLDRALTLAATAAGRLRRVPGLDVLAHPAGREGLGLALLEAASAGVPVVACAVGGLPDAVVDGETGLLVGRDDASGMTRALRSLLGSPETRARFGAAARRHVERRFDVSKLVGAHHSLYTRVLGERAAAAAPVGLE